MTIELTLLFHATSAGRHRSQLRWEAAGTTDGTRTRRQWLEESR